MAEIGETVDPSELEEAPASAPAPQDKLKTALDYIKGMGREGVDQLEAGLTGAAGPFTAVPAGILALEMKAAQGGDLSDRFKQAQQVYANNLGKHPVAGMAGAALSPASKLPGGVASLALQGAAQSSGLGGSALGGAAIGGGIGALGKLLGAGINKAANSEMLSPLLNRLKYLKPSAEEAEPLSEAGQNIREALSDTGAQGMWGGLPSRETMLGRLQQARGKAGSQIGDMLEKADLASPGGTDVPFTNANAVRLNQNANANALRINPRQISDLATEQQANVVGASDSLAGLNRAKSAINSKITNYPSNASQADIDQINGGNSYLRALAKDVRGAVNNRIGEISQIDPSVDANAFSAANKQYGSLSDLISPLSRAIGKDISSDHTGGNIRMGTTGHMYAGLADLLNLGGRRQLAQAHAGEFLQDTSKALSTYKPSQAVARAFVAGTTPGINKQGDELEDQP